MFLSDNLYERDNTNDSFPMIFSNYYCSGSEANLSSCGGGLTSSIQYCTLSVVKLKCISKLHFITLMYILIYRTLYSWRYSSCWRLLLW